MPGGSAKRRLKKLKRQGDEAQTIVEQLMGLFMAHNITVNFPYEIPNIVGQLLANNGQGVPNHQQAVVQANASLDRLRQLTAGGQPVPVQAPPPQPQAVQPPPSPAAPQTDPWAAAASGSAAPVPAAAAAAPPPVDPWGAAAEAPLAPPPAPAPPPQAAPQVADDGAPMSHEEMMARFEAGQARMMDRVATDGVQYKHGAQGPASGQRIAPAPGVQTGPAQPQPAPGPAPAPAPMPTGGGGKRGMNGLTTEEARAIIARTTGREIKPPGANPVPKPPGM